MRYLWATVAIAISSMAGASAQACAAGSAYIENGNWYCQAVNGVSYTHFGTPGQYQKVTSFNDDGKCSSVSNDYAGGISPLDEEVTWHFRGPLSLKQFAFYTPGTSAKVKRNLKPNQHKRRHADKHKGAKIVHAVKKREPCEEITATMNGQIVSWMNNYDCDPTTSTPTDVSVSDTADYSSDPAATTAPVATPSAMPTMNAGAGNWGRQAYYNAENQTAQGLVFLNHNGGQGSGVFDYTWGNSLSYSSSDATTGSASPEILADGMLDDDIEVVVTSSTPCSGNDCGTVRPGTVAMHGFEGSQKLFLMEFQMPLTGKTGWVQDMPAIWTLNAQIPNTLQYGEATCSCWESGCGEWDIFEILDSGNTKAKSTFHGNPSGGDSNYFNRPVDSTIKAAVIFDGDANAGHIVVLPDDTVLDSSISNDIVAGWVNQMQSGAQAGIFKLGS